MSSFDVLQHQSVRHRKSTKELITLLKAVFKSTGKFVPYQMWRKHPDAFLKLVHAQTQVLDKNQVIHLNHIGSEALYYISDHINAVSSVKALLPTKYTNLGQYKVLSVAEKDFPRVRAHFQKYISSTDVCRNIFNTISLNPELFFVNLKKINLLFKKIMQVFMQT